MSIKRIKYLFGDNLLLKVTSLNSAGVVIKVAAGFITQKAIALLAGPQGMGVIGNLRDFVTALQSVGSLGISNGVIKYAAEYKNDPEKRNRLIGASLQLAGIGGLTIALLVFLTASHWNDRIFSEGFAGINVVKTAALAIPFYALNVVLMAVINGMSRYKLYVAVNIVSNLLGMAVMVVLLLLYRLDGALYAVVLTPILALLTTLAFMFFKGRGFALVKSGRNGSHVRKLGTFSLMALLSGLAAPAVRIAIRDIIDAADGELAVGYWEAVFRISNFYLMFITSLMTLYILPKFSEITSRADFRKEVLNFYKTVLPLFASGLFLVWLLRKFIITVLLSRDFGPMEPLFAWQVTGDFFKVAAMVLAYRFWAKNLFWPFVITELFSLSLLYALSVYFVSAYGFTGASMAYCLQSLIYFAVVLVFFRKQLFFRNPQT